MIHLFGIAFVLFFAVIMAGIVAILSTYVLVNLAKEVLKVWRTVWRVIRSNAMPKTPKTRL